MSEFFIEGEGINAGAFIARAIGEGIGVTAARDMLREAGLRMSNQTFSNMYGSIRDSIGTRDELAGIDYSQVPPEDRFRTWAAGSEGDYLSFVESQVRIPGTDQLDTRYFTFRTAEPHTLQDAIDAAADFYTDNEAAAIGYGGGTYLGSYVTSVARAL